MTKQSIIAVYRKEGRATVLESDSAVFTDRGMSRERYQAKMIPLERVPAKRTWDFALPEEKLPQLLKDLEKTKQRLITNPDLKEASVYALMYAPETDPKMARLGVLFEKKADGFVPITIEIEGLDYFVEVKGLGSPIGGMPSFHDRKQVGTEKQHARVTGGLSEAGGRSEHQRLIELRDQEEVTRGLQPLGFLSYELNQEGWDPLDMSQLLRLSPSSIRFSFSENAAINDLQDFNQRLFYQAAAKEVGRFLRLKRPLIHRNITWHNMLYCDKDDYVLSDYEELSPAAMGHCNLDLLDQFYPSYLNFYPYRGLWGPFFTEAIKEEEGQVFDTIREIGPKRISELNEALWRALGIPLFRERLKDGRDFGFLSENLQMIRGFMPESYFKRPLWDWIETELLVMLRQQLTQLERLEETEKGLGLTALNEALERLRNEKEATGRPKRERDLGAYKSPLALETLFLAELKAEIELRLRIESLKTLIEQAMGALERQTIVVEREYLSSFFKLRNQLDFYDLPSLVFPFIPYLAVYVENEAMILRGIEERESSLSSEERLHFHAYRERLQGLQKTLYHNPETLYPAFKASEKDFLEAVGCDFDEIKP